MPQSDGLQLVIRAEKTCPRSGRGQMPRRMYFRLSERHLLDTSKEAAAFCERAASQSKERRMYKDVRQV